MNKRDYIDGVMKRLNELGWDDPLAGMYIGSDTSKTERQIAATFRDAWRKTAKIAPKNFFKCASFAASPPIDDISTGTGYVILPSDYYMLTEFRMSEWIASAYDAPEETRDLATVQANDYTRGSWIRPVCLVAKTGNGLALRYYSIPRGAQHIIDKALYVALPAEIEGEADGYELGITDSGDDRLYDPLMWIHAGIVSTMFEKYELAAICDAKAAECV